MTMPLSIRHAKIIDGLAQRYGVLPSRVLEEPSALVMHTAELAYEEPRKN